VFTVGAAEEIRREHEGDPSTIDPDVLTTLEEMYVYFFFLPWSPYQHAIPIQTARSVNQINAAKYSSGLWPLCLDSALD
jgi:hypothetical protein